MFSLEAFQKVMSNEQPSVAHQLNIATQQKIADNRLKPRCGRQNISLRGHGDSLCDVEKNRTASHGNFWALLEFRVSAGDTVLQEHLAKAPANARYTSPTIQSEIAEILCAQVRVRS